MHCSVVHAGQVIGTVVLRPGPLVSGTDVPPPHVGELEATAAYEAIRDVCRGSAAAIDPEVAEPTAAQVGGLLARLGAVAALGLALVDEAGRAVPTVGPVLIQDFSLPARSTYSGRPWPRRFTTPRADV